MLTLRQLVWCEVQSAGCGIWCGVLGAKTKEQVMKLALLIGSDIMLTGENPDRGARNADTFLVGS